MKHFYNVNSVLTVTRPAANALGTALGSTMKLFTLVLLSFFLLVSGELFGQTTFYSFKNGPWNELSSWSTKDNGPQQTPANLPGATDFVIIKQAHTIIVNNDQAVCKSLTLEPGTGNQATRSSGKIAIGYNPINKQQIFTTNAKLTLGTLTVSIGNGTPKENGEIYIGGKGTLAVTEKIERVGNSGQGSSSLIYYEFHKGSTVEYSSTIAPQNIYKFSNINLSDTATINSGAYQNLVLSGSGQKNAIDVNNNSVGHSLVVNENLIVKGSAEFMLGDSPHTVGRDFIVQDANAKVTGNSTVAGQGLTIGGNVTNAGAISFQTRSLTVGGNFTNNTGGSFTAGSGAHTITGNFTNNTGATFTAGLGSHTIKGNFNNNTEATFTAGSGTHTISGNWTNAGTFDAGTGTIVLNGTSKTISSTGAFNNLTVSNSKTLLSDITVNGSLSVNNTILDTGDKTIVLGVNGNILSTEDGTQHIKGAIETTRSLPANRTNSEIFGNIGFRIPVGTELGSIKVRRETGKAFLSPLTGYSSVNRQFYVTSASGAAPDALNTAIEMDFPAHDLTGNAPYEIYRVTGAGNMTIDNLKNTLSSAGLFGYGVANAQKFGMFTISSTITPLPVELVSFKAQRHAQGVNLTWATASELDNKGFEVQVSTNSKDFTAIGFVESKVGTTSIRQDYSFLDTKAVSGTRYYRLKQIDFDGKFEYSAIRAVALDGGNGEVATYPNPFDDVVVVKLNGTEARNVKLVLFNAQGKAIIEQQQETAGNTITVDMSSVTTKGMYILHVLDKDAKHSFKLMKR